jgi:hypothetical protein
VNFLQSKKLVKLCGGAIGAVYLGSLLLLSGCASSHQNTAGTEYVDFLVSVGPDRFVLRLVTPEQIALARARVAGTQRQGIVSGHIADSDGGFNLGKVCSGKWTWHYIPKTVTFPYAGPELCNGSPSAVEANRDYWIKTLGMLCPRSARILQELGSENGGSETTATPK